MNRTTTAKPVLTAFRYSVYSRAARLALEAKGVAYDILPIDPFSDQREGLSRLHPFGRVPVLEHEGAVIYETSAILRYVDTAFQGPPLQPDRPLARARMDQVIGIVDAYGYWPMVRQVFAHRVFRPRMDEAADETEISAGVVASGPVLDALERIAGEGLVLTGTDLTLADCHLAPMVDYFARTAEGRGLLAGRAALARWWDITRTHPLVRATDPGL